MILHLFIVKSGLHKPDLDRIIASFVNMNTFVNYIENDYRIINRYTKMSDWYCVIYDNEIPDAFLAEGIKDFLLLTNANAVGVYKKVSDKMLHKSVRFFRKGVEIQNDRLLPKKKVKTDFMLNGWLEEYAHN